MLDGVVGGPEGHVGLGVEAAGLIWEIGWVGAGPQRRLRAEVQVTRNRDGCRKVSLSLVIGQMAGRDPDFKAVISRLPARGWTDWVTYVCEWQC